MTDNNSLLLKRVFLGDKTAEEELVKNNMGLVINAAKRFANRGCDFDELTQVGAIGLIKAIKRFDTSFGVCFSTYAVPMIIGEIRRFLRDDSLIKISRSIKECAARGKIAAEVLRRTLMREPTVGEIAAKAGVTVEELVEANDAMSAHESVYYENESSPMGERLCAPNREDTIINKVLVKELLDRLAPREKQIMLLRYFRDKTQAQTAEIIGVSQVQISRLEKGILEKMRDMLT